MSIVIAVQKKINGVLIYKKEGILATIITITICISDFMKKQKLPKKEEIIGDYDGCFDYEEALLTNFRNKDKVVRKENRW